MTDLSTLDWTRAVLSRVTFLPGCWDKRFVRQIAAMDLDRVTELQWQHVTRLAWKYRRQMPWELVPSGDAVREINNWVSAS